MRKSATTRVADGGGDLWEGGKEIFGAEKGGWDASPWIISVSQRDAFRFSVRAVDRQIYEAIGGA